MKIPPGKTQAGGNKKGLSVVLEGTDQKTIEDLTKTVSSELSKLGKKVTTGNALRSYEENVLVANQYLLDTASAPLSPETLSLMVVIKLRERLRRSKLAKSQGSYVVSNISWLGDAYYYELRGKKDVSQQIIADCGFMKPDVWVVIDQSGGVYARLAKQTGVSVLSPKLAKQKILTTILDLIKKAEKSAHKIPKTVEPDDNVTQKVSFLAATIALCNPKQSAQVFPLTDGKLSYYRPKNFGAKVLGAYDIINKKLLENYAQAVTVLSKNFATQALRNQKPFKVEALKAKATGLCLSLLPVSTVIDVKPRTNQKLEELKDENSKNLRIDELFPNIDPEQPKPGINLIGHTPRNEFEVIESIIFEQSDQSAANIKKMTDELSYEQKSSILKSLVVDGSTATSLSNVSYQFDATGEFRQLFDLLKLTQLEHVIFQKLTPRYGYDIPKPIEEAGLTELYEQSFDLSLELYSLLQAAGFDTQAQYAVLLGHRARYRLSINILQVNKLIEHGKNPSVRSLIDNIKQQASDVHPLLYEVDA